jgi:hypothetical protein
MRERSVGLGVMGFHSFLQARGIGFESAMAKAWNMKMFKHIRARPTRPRWCSPGTRRLPRCRGHGRDGALLLQDGDRADRVDLHHLRRHLACIEPIPANIYTHKTLSGSFVVKNPYLKSCWSKRPRIRTNVWNSILEHGGSVQHLDFLSPEEKDTFKTSFEIDQRWLLELAADRTPYIDQAQSLNLFIPADVDKWDLLMLHFRAWELGIKSLYYLRSKSCSAPVSRAGWRRTTPPTRRRSNWPASRPIMRNAWPASEVDIVDRRGRCALAGAFRSAACCFLVCGLNPQERNPMPFSKPARPTSRSNIPGPMISGSASSRSTGCPRKCRWARIAAIGRRRSASMSATC